MHESVFNILKQNKGEFNHIILTDILMYDV